MRKNALISRSRSSLNIYLPEELRPWLGRHWLMTTMGDPLPDGSLPLILRPDGSGRSRVTEHASPLRPIRVMLQNRHLRGALLGLAPFGPTELSWERGESEGEVLFSLPPESSRAGPTGYAPARKIPVPRTRSAAPAPAARATPHERLKALLTELNALLASGDVSDVELRAMPAGRQEGKPMPVCGPVTGSRIEEYG